MEGKVEGVASAVTEKFKASFDPVVGHVVQPVHVAGGVQGGEQATQHVGGPEDVAGVIV